MVAVLAVVTALTAAAVPASAHEDPPHPPPVEVSVEDPTVQAFASSLAVPLDQAAELLAVQQEAGVVEDRLVTEFPATYGGRWWSFEERRAKFGMTADIDRAASSVSQSRRGEFMDVVEVRYSLTQLENASRALGTIIERSDLNGIEAGVDTSLNAVVIGLPSVAERTAEHQRILDDAV